MFGMSATPIDIRDQLRAYGSLREDATNKIVGIEEQTYALEKALQSNRVVIITGGAKVGKTTLVQSISDRKVVVINPAVFGSDAIITSDDVDKEDDKDTIYVIDLDLCPKDALLDMIIPHITRGTKAKVIVMKTTKEVVASMLSNNTVSIFDPSDYPKSTKDNAIRLHVNEAGESKTLRILDAHNDGQFNIDGFMLKAIVKIGAQYFPMINNPERSLNILRGIWDAKNTHVNKTHLIVNEALSELHKEEQISEIFENKIDEKVQKRFEVTEEIYKKDVVVIKGIKSSVLSEEEMVIYKTHTSGIFDEKLKNVLKDKENVRKAVEATKQNKFVKVDVTTDDLSEVIQSMTSVNKDRLVDEISAILEKVNDNKSNQERLATLETNLKKDVIGQDKAVRVIVDAIAVNSAGISEKSKPIASFMFLGTTGVGKTHIAKSLAKHMYGDESNMIRFDMSEFQQEHSSEKLIGAPPGYVGHEAGGILTNAVSKNKNCIILLDEIEKGHPKIYDLFLQVLDDGRLTDSKGMVVDFSHTIIIMTSNIGATHIMAGNDELADAELKQRFRPEFLNRIDSRLKFNPLSKGDVRRIVKSNLNKLTSLVNRKKGVEIQFADTVCDFIVEKGYDAHNGARPIARAINKYIEIELAKKFNSLEEFTKLFVTVDNNKIEITKEELYA